MASKLGNLLLLEQPLVQPPLLVKRFTVWCGSSISPAVFSISQLCERALSLIPGGSSWDDVEILMKAGEGGSWQARHLHPSWGDSHPLALDGPEKLASHRQEAQWSGVTITPYVVVRRTGNVPGQDWTKPEQQQIKAAYLAMNGLGRVVLNVEPGSQYDNGPKNPLSITEYMLGIGVPRQGLEVCLIPRRGQVNELGGNNCVFAWTSNAGSASWECYGITAGVPGDTSLLVNEAIPRISKFGWAPAGASYRIPVVQRDERETWSGSEWAEAGMQVWYMDGN